MNESNDKDAPEDEDGPAGKRPGEDKTSAATGEGGEVSSETEESAPVVTGTTAPGAKEAADLPGDGDDPASDDGERVDDPYAGVVTGTTAAGAGAAEPHDIAVAADHHDDDYDHAAAGSTVAGAALRFLIIVLVVFALSLWAVPMLAPHLPASIAQHIMPGQKALDMRLAEIDEQVREQTAAALEDVERMRKEIADLQTRVNEAETATVAAQKEAAEARKAAEESARAATSVTVAEETVTKAQKAVAEAEGAAVTATTAATEAGKVAASATRETASLARRMTSFEARIAALTEETSAVGKALSEASSAGNGSGAVATPELTAALAQLQTRLDNLSKKIGEDAEFLSAADADRFATQDDLRSSRVALSTEIKESIAKLPEPGAIVTESELDSARTELASRLAALEERITAAERKAADATETATAASEASEKAEGKVEVAIRDAATRAAVAALTSRIDNGQPYGASLAELEQLTGETAPEELSGPAERGVATVDELRRSFGRRAQEAISATIRAEADGEGLLGKASARLRSVVAGRPKDEQEGDDVGAVISRIEARLRDAELGAALEEAKALPDPARNALDDWLQDLATRVAADRAAEGYIDKVAREQG